MMTKPTLHLVCNAHLDPAWQWDWQRGEFGHLPVPPLHPDGFVSADRQWYHFAFDDNRHHAVYYGRLCCRAQERFYDTKFLQDVRDAQWPNGRFPDFAPNPLVDNFHLAFSLLSAYCYNGY